MRIHWLVALLTVALVGCAPTMPVAVTIRPSVVGQGQVAQFHNQTNSQLTVNVLFENKKLNQRKEGAINIPPSGTTEIGWLEGWRFLPGETITVSHPEYQTKILRIP